MSQEINIENWREEYKKLVLTGDIKTAKRIVRENASQIKLFKFYRGRVK